MNEETLAEMKSAIRTILDSNDRIVDAVLQAITDAEDDNGIDWPIYEYWSRWGLKDADLAEGYLLRLATGQTMPPQDLIDEFNKYYDEHHVEGSYDEHMVCDQWIGMKFGG